MCDQLYHHPTCNCHLYGIHNAVSGYAFVEGTEIPEGKTTASSDLHQFSCADPNCLTEKPHTHATFASAFFVEGKNPDLCKQSPIDVPSPKGVLCCLPYHARNCRCGGTNPLAEKMLQEQQGRLIAQNPDLINHPPHYTKGAIDTFDFIKAKGLSYAEGNVIKYITRSRHKGKRLDDLRKAEWYLKQLIAGAENE